MILADLPAEKTNRLPIDRLFREIAYFTNFRNRLWEDALTGQRKDFIIIPEKCSLLQISETEVSYGRDSARHLFEQTD